MEWQILAWGRLANAAAGGLIVLAVGSLAAWLCRQPVRRARLVVLTLVGGVAVPWLGALPVAPRWSTGLLPASAPVRSSRPTTALERTGRRPTGRRAGRGTDARSPRLVRRRRPSPRRVRSRRSAAGEAGPRDGAGSLPPAAHARARGVCRRDGRAGGLVVARAGRALAGHPRGASGAGRRSATSSSASPGRRGSGSCFSRATGSPCRSPSPGPAR